MALCSLSGKGNLPAQPHADSLQHCQVRPPPIYKNVIIVHVHIILEDWMVRPILDYIDLFEKKGSV